MSKLPGWVNRIDSVNQQRNDLTNLLLALNIAWEELEYGCKRSVHLDQWDHGRHIGKSLCEFEETMERIEKLGNR